jgi:tripartite-type tricarboxylate transporter receptor subunit TctC
VDRNLIGDLNRRSFIGAAGALSVAGCSSAQAETVRIIVGAGAGSAQDRFARLLLRHLAPFGVTGAVEDQPAAGGKLAAQRLARARVDSNLIAFLPTGLIYSTLLQEEGVDFDLSSFGWLGGLGRDRRVLAVSGMSGLKRFEDLLAPGRPAIFASTAAASPGSYETRIVRYLTGARIKDVPGYAGGARNMALVNGEADGVVASVDGLEPVLALPGAKLLLRLNDLPLPPGVVTSGTPPLLAQFARGPDAAVLLELISAHADFGRILALPPSAPPERLALWRDRLTMVTAQPAFQQAAQAQGFLLDPTPGDAVSRRMSSLLKTQATDIRPALHRALSAG